ncbi:sentrin-specific protease 2-like [Corticium candelabrum]|uniref:sentrin-specific protease 2-like n=1 Tax=Corticium candelabrum TaxID=121492 RepID=UPI002E260F76|nr:sentrin-specific protease 2-like [Corticium candelabrum]
MAIEAWRRQETQAKCFHYELLAIPVYLTNHWIEVIIDIVHQAFLVFDSLGKKHEQVVFDLKLWITDVYRLVNGSTLDVTDSSLIYPIPQNYPQQTDPFNCGIWTCVNMLSAAVDNPRVASNVWQIWSEFRCEK